MPRPLKGRLWKRLGLPARPELWTYEPPQLDLPSASRLRPTVALAPKPRKTQLLVAHQYLSLGGAGAVMLNLLARIDRNRFDVHLITTDREPYGDPGRLPLRKFAEQTDSIYQLPSFLEKDYYLRFLIDFIASRRVDVVLVSLSVFTYQALPQLRAACPDTAFLDLLHAEAPYAPMDHIRLASRYRQFLDRRVVTTELVRSAQIAKYGETADRVVVIPNGIDTAGTFNPRGASRGAFRRELGIGREVTIVLYYGRMAVEKQPMHVVDVAERLRERSDIAFILLGDGSQTSVVQRAISARGLTNVYLAPTREDIRTVIADADVMMFPSKREGLPMAGLESMSMGKPIVASRVPGWIDLVSDGTEGFLVEDGDIAGYADAMTRLLADRALYDLMSRAGRDKARRGYDLRDTVGAWERLLSAPLRKTGPARS
jgi:glycosyltransferase involved in cell wall biosynthesis